MGILKRFFTRASLEDPRVSLYDNDGIDELFGGSYESAAGVRVSERKALSYPPLWRAVNLISSDVAKLPLEVFERIDGEGREASRKHPAYSLVRRMANEDMAASVFRKTLTFHALFFGNGFGAVYRDGRGNPQELVVLGPNTYPCKEGGRLVYKTTVDLKGENKPGDMKRFTIDKNDVIHIRNLSHDGMAGYNVISLMKDALGSGIAARDFAAKFFAGGATAAGILQIEGTVDPKRQREMIKDFATYASGWDNVHKFALIQGGAKWVPTTIDPEKSQMMEAQKWGLIDVSNIFGVPPHKIGHDMRSSFSSLEQENRSYLDQCLGHWLNTWETELWCKLLSPQEKKADSHFFEFNQNALIKADILTRFSVHNIGVNSGITKRNEARAAENMPPVEYGDEIFVPANLIPLKRLFEQPATDDDIAPDPAEPAEPAKDPSEVPPEQQPDVVTPADEGVHIDDLTKNSFVALTLDRVQRLSKVEQNAITRAARKEDNFLEWMESFLSQQEFRYLDALGFVLRPWAILHRSESSVELKTREVVLEYLDSLRSELLEVSGKSSKQNLEQNVSSLRCWSKQSLDEFVEKLLECVNE